MARLWLQKMMIASHFATRQEAAQKFPNGTRIFYSSAAVEAFSASVFEDCKDSIVIADATERVMGAKTHQDSKDVNDKVNKMWICDLAGHPSKIAPKVGAPYMLTANID